MMTKHAFAVILATMVSSIAASRRPNVSPWKPPAPTETLEPYDRAHLRFSPRPTVSPVVHVADDLRKRDSASSSTSIDTNTCGFLTDDGLALSCDPAYTCTNIGKYRGCCVGSECKTSSLPTVCYGATETQCDDPGPETMCCTQDINYPYCVTYLWSTSATPTEVFSLFNCDRNYYAGEHIISAEPFAITATAASSSSGSQETVPANNGGGGNNTASSTSTSASSASDAANSSTPVGAIVGGVIGGLAVIGIVVLGVVFMVLRHRKQQAAKKTNTAGDEAAPLSGSGPNPGSSPAANRQGSLPVKVEDCGTETTEHSTPPPQGTYPTPTEEQYANLLYPDGKPGHTKRLSELGDDRRSELGNDRRSELGGDVRPELGGDQRAELPT